MRRTVMLAVMLSCLLCSLSLANAFEVCWRLFDGAPTPNPLLDVIKCEVDLTKPSIFPATCVQDAPPLYQMIGAGGATPNTVPTGTFRLEYSPSHTAPGFFGNNRVCAFTAILTGSLNGTWTQQCAGGPGAPFNVSGIIQTLACPGQVFAFEQNQREMATQQTNTFGEPMAAGKGNFVTLAE
jgi:hypothetical protein